MNSLPLYEQWRPRTWDAVVGQGKVIKPLLALRLRSGFGGKAIWLSGGSGQGKTTIARLIAADIAGELATREENAKDIDLEYVREMERSWHCTAIPSPGSDKTGRAWVFNESHNLRASVCERLLTTLEAIPGHVVIAFTTTVDAEKGLFEDYDGSKAFMSRCLKFKLARTSLKEPFAAYLRQCAGAVGLDGRPIEDYERLIADNGNSLRAGFQAVEAGWGKEGQE